MTIEEAQRDVEAKEQALGKSRLRYAINSKIVITPKSELTKPTKGASVGNVGEPSEALSFFG